MKHTAITVAVLATLGLSACSSTKTADVRSGAPISAGTQQGIAEQRLESSFKRQGIKIIYSMNGSLEAIETTGYAPVWGNSQNAAREAFRVAELEAKKSLNDFINQETIRSTTSVRMISKNLEKARDNKTNNFATNRGRDSVAAMTEDAELVTEPGSGPGEVNREENTAVRNDALTIASRVSTTITTQNRGILGGLYLVEGRVINDGKNVQVVYRWDAKHTDVRKQIRGLMAQ
jgi:hypothetical protein